MQSHKVKILVIRFSSIGDIVLTTPVLRCLKNQLEGEVEIDYLTKKQYELIVANNPNVNKVYSIEKSTNEVIENLKNEGYHYIIDLHKNLRSKRVIRQLQTLSFTFSKLNYKKWLLTNFKINKLPKIHIVDRYMDAVKPLGVKKDDRGLEYYIPNNDQVTLTDLPKPFQKGYIAFAIGAQHKGKKLPAYKITEICAKINHPIVLLGGKEDMDIAEEILAKSKGDLFNACGRYSLNQSASLIKQAKLVITHDTGLMHIASAFSKKIISLWGCTSPVFGMYPYLPDEESIIIEPIHLTKRPCSKLGDKCSYGDFRCAKEIDNEKVVAAINKLW